MIFNNFTQTQLAEYKKKLHSSIHWLLIYKEADDYIYFDTYFNTLLIKIETLNDLVGYQDVVMELYTTLLSAKKESSKEDCSFKLFRKLILDSHSLLDRVDFRMATEDKNG